MAIWTNVSKLCLMWTENHSKIIRVNCNYLARLKLLKSQSLSRNTITKLHKTHIPPITTYVSEVNKVTTDVKKTFRLFERQNVRKMYRPVQEGEPWGIMMNKAIKDSSRGRYCKTYTRKIPPTKMVWPCWKNAKPTNAKTNCISCNGMKKNEGRRRKWWGDKVQEDSNTIGIKNRQAVVRHVDEKYVYTHTNMRIMCTLRTSTEGM